MNAVTELRSILLPKSRNGEGEGDGEDPVPPSSAPAAGDGASPSPETPYEAASEPSLRSAASGLLAALFDEEIRGQIDTGRYDGAKIRPSPLSRDIIEGACLGAPLEEEEEEGAGEKERVGTTRRRRRSSPPVPPSRRGGYRHTDTWDVPDCVSELAGCVVDAASAFLSSSSPPSDGDGHGPPPASFDKDHPLPMSFVTAASNLRSAVFGIEPLQSLYEAKGIAGNIIPAIATTNAVVAGLQVLQAFHVLRWRVENEASSAAEAGGGDERNGKGGGGEGGGGESGGQKNDLRERCRYVYCNRNRSRKGHYLQPSELPLPNPSCYVCRSACVVVSLDLRPGQDWTLGTLVRRLLKSELGFVSPTVLLAGDLIYEEGDELEEDEVAAYRSNLTKRLGDLPCGGIRDGSSARVEDFGQDLEVEIRFAHREEWGRAEEEGEGEGGKVLDEGERFEIGGERPKGAASGGETIENGAASEVATTKPGADSSGANDDDDDDIEIVVDDNGGPPPPESETLSSPSKKRCRDDDGGRAEENSKKKNRGEPGATGEKASEPEVTGGPAVDGEGGEDDDDNDVAMVIELE